MYRLQQGHCKIYLFYLLITKRHIFLKTNANKIKWILSLLDCKLTPTLTDVLAQLFYWNN